MREMIKRWAFIFCNEACILTGHWNGCALITPGGILYRVYIWSLS